MIIIEHEVIAYADGYKITTAKPMFCPNCNSGLAMWKYGFRSRKVKDFQGRSYRINLQRYYCQICHSIFVILPSFLIPYKQYDRMTIASVQNGFIHGCGASYMSVYYWRRIVI